MALNSKIEIKYQYFKIIDSRTEWLGIRYFKYSPHSDKVVQVCVTTGEVKKGKSNTFGVYLIASLTFLCNYLAVGYCQPCTKKQYEKAFETVVTYLK